MSNIYKSDKKITGNIILDEQLINDIVHKTINEFINSSDLSKIMLDSMKKIVEQKKVSASNIISNGSEVDSVVGKISNYPLEDFKNQYKFLDFKYRELEIKYKELEGVHKDLHLQNLIKKEENEKLINELNDLKNEYDAILKQNTELSNEYNNLSTRYDNCQNEKDSVYAEFTQLEIILKKKKKENKILTDILNNTFAKGRELLQVLIKLPKEYRNYLESEIIFDSLESFIISSTLSFRTLLRIWEAAYDAIVTNEDLESFNILWSYFEYTCYLYNIGRQDDVMEISDIQVGDSYDARDVSADPTSAPRGKIQHIYIRGFVNKNTEEKIAKSYVHVE